MEWREQKNINAPGNSWTGNRRKELQGKDVFSEEVEARDSGKEFLIALRLHTVGSNNTFTAGSFGV